MKTDVELQAFLFDILEIALNQTASHRTDLPMKTNQSLNFVIEADINQDLLTRFIELRNQYSFLEMDNITDKTIEKWSFFGVKKPVPFRLRIDCFEDLKYEYRGKYTFMNFKFGGMKFELPIERIEDTFEG